MAVRPDLREATRTDHDALGQLMYDAVQTATAYTPAQRHAWLSRPHQGPDWSDRLSGQTVWIAEWADQPVGMMSLEGSGKIDLAFIAVGWRKSGLFRALYLRIEDTARANGYGRLQVEASRMAEPAFKTMGFSILKADPVARHGEILHRVIMEKLLTQGEPAHE